MSNIFVLTEKDFSFDPDYVYVDAFGTVFYYDVLVAEMFGYGDALDVFKRNLYSIESDLHKHLVEVGFTSHQIQSWENSIETNAIPIEALAFIQTFEAWELKNPMAERLLLLQVLKIFSTNPPKMPTVLDGKKYNLSMFKELVEGNWFLLYGYRLLEDPYLTVVSENKLLADALMFDPMNVSIIMRRVTNKYDLPRLVKQNSPELGQARANAIDEIHRLIERELPSNR